MEKQYTTKIMIASIGAVMLFSIGIMQTSYEQTVSQGTLSITSSCTAIIQDDDMVFGSVDAGAGNFVQGFFTLRNTGNQVAPIDLSVGPNNGAWATGGDVAIITAANTEIFEDGPTGFPFDTGTSLGTLAAVPLTLTNLVPDFLSPTNNDNRVDIETEAILQQAFAGDLFLDLLLIINPCVTT